MFASWKDTICKHSIARGSVIELQTHLQITRDSILHKGRSQNINLCVSACIQNMKSLCYMFFYYIILRDFCHRMKSKSQYGLQLFLKNIYLCCFNMKWHALIKCITRFLDYCSLESMSPKYLRKLGEFVIKMNIIQILYSRCYCRS